MDKIIVLFLMFILCGCNETNKVEGYDWLHNTIQSIYDTKNHLKLEKKEEVKNEEIKKEEKVEVVDKTVEEIVEDKPIKETKKKETTEKETVKVKKNEETKKEEKQEEVKKEPIKEKKEEVVITYDGRKESGCLSKEEGGYQILTSRNINNPIFESEKEAMEYANGIFLEEDEIGGYYVTYIEYSNGIEKYSICFYANE